MMYGKAKCPKILFISLPTFCNDILPQRGSGLGCMRWGVHFVFAYALQVCRLCQGKNYLYKNRISPYPLLFFLLLSRLP